MTRTIITDLDLSDRGGRTADATRRVARRKDEYVDRLIKYIPADVIAVYLTVDRIVRNAGDIDDPDTYLWFAFIALLILTPFYLRRVAGVTKWLQIGISAAAFVVWVFALGGPFSGLGWYDATFAAIVLPLFTFAVSIIEPNR